MIRILLTTSCGMNNGHLVRAVDSLLQQSYSNFELVICDDGSTDGTEQYLHDVAARDSRVKTFRNPRKLDSIAISLARCFKASDTARPLLTWMSDDCVLLPEALERLVASMDGAKAIDFAYGILNRRTPDGALTRAAAAPPEVLARELEDSLSFSPKAGVVVRCGFLEQSGWLDASVVLREATEWDFFRRMLKLGTGASLPFEVAECPAALDALSRERRFAEMLPLLKRYIERRDAAQWPVTLDAALYHPVDRIPPGDWTDGELRRFALTMLEYFASVGDAAKAYEWASRARERVKPVPEWLERLTSRRSGDRYSEAAELGLAAGIVYGAGQLEDLSAVQEGTKRMLANTEAEMKTLEAVLEEARAQLTDARAEIGALKCEVKAALVELYDSRAETAVWQKNAEEVAAREREAREHAGTLEERAGTLEQHIDVMRAKLGSRRYRIADAINGTIKKQPLLHRVLKRFAGSSSKEKQEL